MLFNCNSILFLILLQDMKADDNYMEIQLYFNARNLKDSDVFSKSDPFVKVFMQQNFYGNVDFIGRTQTKNNTVHPNWDKSIPVQYYFQQKQPLRIEVYDQDDSNNAQFLGKVQTTLGHVMGQLHQTALLDLVNEKGKSVGKLIIRAQKIQSSSMALKMKWRGKKIQNVDSVFDFWDKSDPYLKFMKLRGDNTFVQITRTQVLMDNHEPNWKPISVSLGKLVSSENKLGTFKVQCWDWDQKDQKHQFIGETMLSLDDIKKSNGPMDIKLNNPKSKKPGMLLLENVEFVSIPNFIDYLKSGLQINMVAAIDFTGSNGIPTSPNSLHYISKPPTQYQLVLKSIWQIVSNYDSDKRIPAFGFGAKPHFPNLNQNQANHCFPLTGDYKNCQIGGFDNLMNAYMSAVSNMQFAGPTYFVPILKKAFQFASSLLNGYSYQILLILTDGAIHDMAETKNLIVQNSNLPLSIVIVGIGNADFENMNELDGDGGLYNSYGQKCPRDIVQFVPFNKYASNSDLLAKQLLKQIPSQVLQYMQMANKPPKPLPPPQKV